MSEQSMIGIAGLFKPFVKERHDHHVKNNDSVRQIFGKRYLCRFNDMLTRHPEDIKTFGVRLSGNELIDKQQLDSEITTWITIATMAHYLRLGIPVKLANYRDSKAIYEAVTYHIRSWREYYTFSLNQAVVPLEDLQALEDLSIAVFPSAKVTMRKEGLVKDHFAKSVDKFNLVSEEGLFIRNDFNEKHKIESTSNSIGSKPLEIIREDNTDYFLSKLGSLPGGLNGGQY